jgi:SAM-dependent methyltransferase
MDYLDLNRKSWNERTRVHVDSDFYDNKTFLEGRNTLNEIELDILGDISGKCVLHLQCHFGQDTISLTRLGAQATGVDLSDAAIDKAREIAEQTGSEAQFINCDVYSLPEYLEGQFDMVFSSYGTIGWLPDINKWAEVVAHFLKPGGQLLLVEFHPVVWMFDDDFEKIGYKYSNSDPIQEEESGSYTDREAPIHTEFISWNHGLGEVVTACVNSGLEIELLNEYDYSPYDCFRHTVEFSPGKFRIKHFEDRIPMVYALLAKKKA